MSGAVSASNYNANVNLVESGSPSTVANSIVKTITGGTTSFTSTNVITAGFVTDSPLKANVLISGGTGAAPYSGYSSTFTVNNQFLQTANSISNTVASQGQAELITASWSGGTSTYTANYFVVNSTNGNIIAHALYTGLIGNLKHLYIYNTKHQQCIRNRERYSHIDRFSFNSSSNHLSEHNNSKYKFCGRSNHTICAKHRQRPINNTNLSCSRRNYSHTPTNGTQ